MNWWENSFVTVRGNEIYLAGRAATRIAEEHGTPLYVYGRDQLLLNFRDLRELLSQKISLEARVCFAMKSNPNRLLLQLLQAEGAWIDAVSPGEFKTAMAAGFPAQKILFTGTSVSARDFEEAFAREGLTVNIDAFEQMELMRDIKRNSFKNKKIRVSVRWNPGMGRGFSPKAITAGERSTDGTPIKFGVEEKKVIPTFEKAVEYGFTPVGLHQHLGSGWVKEDFGAVKAAVDKMVKMAAELEHRGFPLEFVDFGGGFGPKYYRNQSLFPIREYVGYFSEKIRKARLQIRAVAVEPGKYLVGNAGVLLLRVEYVKQSYGNFFACVDGGTFHTVPRPAIYAQAHHEIINCSRVKSGKNARITVAGNLCESGDVFGKDRLMPFPERGDILAVLCAGAYCRSMASNFNLRDIPKEIVV